MGAWFFLVWAISGSELSSLSASAAEGFYLTCRNTKAWCKPPSQWRIIASSVYLFIYIHCCLQHQPLSPDSAWLSVIQQDVQLDESGNEFNLVHQMKRWRLLKVIPFVSAYASYTGWCRAACITSCGTPLWNDNIWTWNLHKISLFTNVPLTNVSL